MPILALFVKVHKKKKNEEHFMKFCSLIAGEWLKGFLLSLKYGISWYGEQLHCKFGAIQLRHHGAM